MHGEHFNFLIDRIKCEDENFSLTDFTALSSVSHGNMQVPKGRSENGKLPFERNEILSAFLFKIDDDSFNWRKKYFCTGYFMREILMVKPHKPNILQLFYLLHENMATNKTSGFY